MRWLVCVVLVMAGCTRPAVHHPATVVTGVEIRGNHAIATEVLRDGLATPRVAELDPYEIDLDIERLRGLYQRRGYFAVAVRAATVGHTVVFEITEGARAALARVEIVGLPPDVDAAALRAVTRLVAGAPFDYEAYRAAEPRMLAALHEAGYARATLEAIAIADGPHREAVAHYAFVPGPRCTFGEVELSGVDGDLAAAARARIAVRNGERYDPRAIAATRDALYAIGRFATVKVEPDLAGSGATVPVRIAVTPASRNEARTGAGVGVDQLTWQARARAGYTRAGALGPLTTADVEGRLALTVPQTAFVPDVSQPQFRFEGEAGLRSLDFLVPRLTGELGVSVEYLALEAYTVLGPRVRAGVSRLLGGKLVEIGAGVQLWALGFSAPAAALDAATIAQLGIDHDENVVAFDQHAVLDLRDAVLAPTRGLYAALHVVEGRSGDGNFVQVTPEARGYLPLGRFVLSARARLGAILGAVPPTERYYAGGAASNRGFAERQLSPVATGDGESVVIGGAGLVDTSLELRAPFGRLFGLPWSGAVFLDGGDVTETAGELPGALYWATGGGLRAKVGPIPVRLDVGVRLDRTGPEDPHPATTFYDRLQLHLGIGEAF